MNPLPNSLCLKSNPFEPSATGAPALGPLSLLGSLARDANRFLDHQESGGGVRAIVVVGDYGSGKSTFLHWLHSKALLERQIKSFYFDNPGVRFYSLADRLLRKIGRKDFAKLIWELSGPYVEAPHQRSLFQRGFDEFLSSARGSGKTWDVEADLQAAIMRAGVTEDEEIAHCFARIVAGFQRKPYFEYRDFVPRQKSSVVAEGEEAPYFQAVLRTIMKGTGTNAVAFLLDEFEEISLQKRLTKRAAIDYLSTLKRLVNLAEGRRTEFWIVLSMTMAARELTEELDPALFGRMAGHTLEIEPLGPSSALDLMRNRLSGARPESLREGVSGLFPFPDEMLFRPTTYQNPRRLVKSCFWALSKATRETELPFSESYLHGIEEELDPEFGVGA